MHAPFIRQLTEEVIEPTLRQLELFSPEAMALVLGTGMVESQYQYIYQVPSGPALGFWQMEPDTHEDIWQNWINFRPGFRDLLENVCHLTPDSIHSSEMMIWNLKYACAMARVHYRRVPEPIPLDLEGQAHYWKEYYNTQLGKGTVTKYLEAWRSVG